MFSSVKSSIETFLSKRENFSTSDKLKLAAAIITLILWIIILLLLSKYLWNEVLCKIVSFTKPVSSVFQIIGLVVLLQILMPS